MCHGGEKDRPSAPFTGFPPLAVAVNERVLCSRVFRQRFLPSFAAFGSICEGIERTACESQASVDRGMPLASPIYVILPAILPVRV
ncbi:unnamed protein product [Heligmosomoides polygyrus]|uniref:Uncharacterized protein n=1 Tax=Heligmosomoides polygyrus TaxID=6339 RepID=A0A183GAM6_HELPZ|nr:unnamed protein product [Heligmosomoides polygyrus]